MNRGFFMFDPDLSFLTCDCECMPDCNCINCIYFLLEVS